MKKCEKCGAMLWDDTLFCTECGSGLNADSTNEVKEVEEINIQEEETVQISLEKDTPYVEIMPEKSIEYVDGDTVVFEDELNATASTEATTELSSDVVELEFQETETEENFEVEGYVETETEENFEVEGFVETEAEEYYEPEEDTDEEVYEESEDEEYYESEGYEDTEDEEYYEDPEDEEYYESEEDSDEEYYDEDGLEYEDSEEISFDGEIKPAEKKKKSKVGLIIGIVVGVLLLLPIIVILIILLIVLIITGGITVLVNWISNNIVNHVPSSSNTSANIVEYEPADDYWNDFEDDYNDYSDYSDNVEDTGWSNNWDGALNIDEPDYGYGDDIPEVYVDPQAQKIESFVLNSYLYTYSEYDIADFTAEDCRLARNGIYARHGRKFKDEELTNYFSQFDWYRPAIEPDDFTDLFLNETEIANRDLIVEFEKKKGYR